MPAAFQATASTPCSRVHRRSVGPAAVPHLRHGLVPPPPRIYCRGQRPGSGRTSARSQLDGPACLAVVLLDEGGSDKDCVPA